MHGEVGVADRFGLGCQAVIKVEGMELGGVGRQRLWIGRSEPVRLSCLVLVDRLEASVSGVRVGLQSLEVCHLALAPGIDPGVGYAILAPCPNQTSLRHVVE